MRTGQAAFLGFSISELLADCTRVLAFPICPTNQCTFVWLNFLPLQFFCSLFYEFEEILSKIFLISFLCGYVCSHWHQSSLATFSERPPKQRWGQVLQVQAFFQSHEVRTKDILFRNTEEKFEAVRAKFRS